jgi:hypothetical protein
LAGKKPNLFKRIQQFVHDLFAKTNDTTLRKVEDKFIKAYKNSALLNLSSNLAKSQSSATTSGTTANDANNAKYSIKKDPSGHSYVHVDTDQHIFDDVDEKDYSKIAKQYIREHFQGVTLAPDGANATVTKRTAEKYTHANHPEQTNTETTSKMKAATELDNLIETSKYLGEEAAKHHSETQKVERYKTTFEVGGKTFMGEPVVFTESNGTRRLYDIANIKETSLQSGAQSKNSHSADLNETSDNNITQNTDDVNSQNQEKHSFKSNKTPNKTPISENAVQSKRELKENIKQTFGLKSLNADERGTLNSIIDEVVKSENINNPESRAALLSVLLENGRTDNPDYRDDIKRIKKDLKEIDVFIPQNVRDELISGMYEDFKAFREAAAGKFRFSTVEKAGQIDIDTAYMELQGKFGTNTFPDYNHPAEMLNRMIEIGRLDDMTETMPIMDYINGQAEELGIEADELIRDLDDKLTQDLKDYGAKVPLEKEYRSYINKIKSAWKNGETEKVKALREKVRKRSTQEKLLKDVTNLYNMAKKSSPTEKTLIAKLIGDIDRRGIKMLKTSYINQKTGKAVVGELDLSQMRDMMKKYGVELPEYRVNELDRLDQKRIGELSSEQFHNLSIAVSALHHQIRNNHMLIEKNKAIDANEQGAKLSEEIKKTSGRSVPLWQLNAKNAFRLLGGKDGVMSKQFEKMNEGQSKMFAFKREATTPIQDFIKANEKEFAKFNEFIDTGLENLRMTPLMRVSLYLHSLNQDNMYHVENGGVVVPDEKLYKKGKIKKAYDNGRKAKLTATEVKTITDGMSSIEKQLAEIAHIYFNETSKKAINETSMLLDGYEKALVENYMPMVSAYGTFETDYSALKRDGTLEGMGMLKERTGAGNAVILEDITESLARSIDNTSKYYGMALPLRNINKLLNVKMQTDGKNAKIIKIVKIADTNIANAVTAKYGGEMMDYIEKILQDMQLPKTKYSALDRKTSRYAQSVLSMNPSSAVQQPTAIFNALAELGIKGWNVFKPADPKVMAANSSVYWYRTQGNQTAELSDITAGRNKLTKNKAIFGWLEAFDDFGMRRIWSATETWVKHNRKDLTPNSAEFNKAVGEKFDRVLYDSQSNSTVLQKAGIMRENNAGTKFITMFQNQAYTNYNQAVSAVMDVMEAHKTGKGKTKAGLKLGGVIGGLLASSISAEMLSSAVKKYLLGRDEEEADVLHSIAAIIPFGGVIYDLGKGFAEMITTGETDWDKNFNGLSSSSFNTINDLLQNFNDLGGMAYKLINEDAHAFRQDKNIIAPSVRKTVINLGKFFGIPVANAEKMLVGAINLGGNALVKLEILPEEYGRLKQDYENWFTEKTASAISRSVNDGQTKKNINLFMDNQLNMNNLSNKNKFEPYIKSEIYRLYELTGKSSVLPNSDTKKVGDTELTLSQRLDYSAKYAEITEPSLTNLIKSDRYKSMNDEDKAKAVNALYTYAEEIAGKSTIEEYEPDKWVLGAEKINKTVPVETSIYYRTEFLRDIYKTAVDKRKTLFADKSLTWKQKEAIDAKILGGDKYDTDKDSADYGKYLGYNGANYKTAGDFEMSFLTDSAQKNYGEFGLADYVGKSKYARAVNDLAAAKIAGVKEIVTKYENGKRVTEEKTVSNSAGLLKREYIETNMKYAVEGLTQKQKAALYEALGIGGTVAGMTAWEFTREINNIKKIMNKKAG